MLTVPAGRYFLGDPCYVIPCDQWHNFCATLVDDKNGSVVVGLLPDAREVFCLYTPFGDGVYCDSTDHEYFVDSGMIGLVPLDYVLSLGNSTEEELNGDGRVVEFIEDSEIYMDDNFLTMNFGWVMISFAEVGNE